MTRTRWFLVGGLLVALLLAGVASSFASSSPDGLDSSLVKGCVVNEQGEIVGGTCPAQGEKGDELADGPLADYGVKGVDNKFLSTGLSGVLGVLITFAIGGGLFWLVRRRSATRAAEPVGTGAAEPHVTRAAGPDGTQPTDATDEAQGADTEGSLRAHVRAGARDGS